ncbi:hypothetical protein MMC30_007349 [Trapelia coarctata]|nr:hypothetical protein [Trapelia coarctata]
MVLTYDFPPTTLLTSTSSSLPTATAPPQTTKQFSSSTSTDLSCNGTCLVALPTILLSIVFLLTTVLVWYYYRQKRQKKLAKQNPISFLPGNYRYAAGGSANSSATTLSVPQPVMVGEMQNAGGAEGARERESARESVSSAFIYSKHTSYDGPAGLALAPPPEPPSTVKKILKRPLSLFSVISRRDTDQGQMSEYPPAPQRREDVDLETGSQRSGMEERREELDEEWARSGGHRFEEVRVSQIGLGR